jgi:hypothetical protein
MKQIILIIAAIIGITIWFSEPPLSANQTQTSFEVKNDTLKHYDLESVEQSNNRALNTIKSNLNELPQLKAEVKVLQKELTNKPDTITIFDTVIDTVFVVDTLKQRKNIFGKVKNVKN